MTQIIISFKFNAEGVVPLIAQGWRQPTLGYACNEEVNAVGVALLIAQGCQTTVQATLG